MKFSIPVAGCCFISLGIAVSNESVATAQRSTAAIVARSIDGSAELGILHIRTNKPAKGSISQGRVVKKGATRQTPVRVPVSDNESTGTSSTRFETRQGERFPKEPLKEVLITQAKDKEPDVKNAMTRPTRTPALMSTLRQLRLGASAYPCPPPCNRALLRPMARLTSDRRPKIRNAHKTSGPEAVGLAIVKGPAQIRKSEGEFGEMQESTIEANEQAIVKARHRFAISISGEVGHGGCITARVQGDCVGAIVDAKHGGRGYVRDESIGKPFKDSKHQTEEVSSGQMTQQSYLGDSLTGSAAAARGKIFGPGAMSMAAMRVPEGGDRKQWMGKHA